MEENMMTKGKKKALIISLSIAGVLAIAVAITLGVLLTRKPAAPQVKEGEIYRTETETFWVGVGSAYISFSYRDAPDEKDAAVYGYVFEVQVNSGGGYSSWLTGTWSLEEENGTYKDLILTATWDDTAENQTTLADAESGVAKTYGLKDGKYTIGVNLPSAGTIDFTLDPVEDKVGGDEKPEEPCTEHVDENSDGKCDNCGADMPETPVIPEEPELLLTMTATDETTAMAAEIKMYVDKTFDFCLEMMGGKVFGGTWSSSDATGQNPLAPITLTVDDTGSPVVGNTITVTITPAQDFSSMTYACHVDYVVPGMITMAFDFTGNFIISA